MAPRKRLGDLLVESGIISEVQLQQALKEQKVLNLRLGDLLITQKYITEQQLFEVLELQLGVPHIQLYRQKIETKIINLIPEKLAEKYSVLPIRIEGNKLVLAMVDPLDYFAIDELRMTTGLVIKPAIASKDELLRAIKRYYGMQESVDQIMSHIQTRLHDEIQVPQVDEDSPVVKTVNQIIIQAVHLGASDIHIDPQEDSLRIRYRIDGLMRTEQTLPPHMQNVIAARIKVMSNMNVAERRIPQDGRVEMDIEFRKIDIRLSTLPTIHGEKVVMRILDMGNALTEIEDLGFSESNLQLFLKGIQHAHGVVLITGPTGSGKTTTLYSALTRLNKDETNIITVEDPVEIQLQGINQVQVNPAIGLTFANGLRSILRQDPNIVMVGEIRDAETAEISVRAAMTGHLVLTTLHSNSAVNSITRLIDMGVEPFLVSSAVNCIVAQRLVRRNCKRCAAEYVASDEEREIMHKYGLSTEHMKKGSGCEFCGRTGYKGRLAIQEILYVDDKLRAMIIQKKSDSEYKAYAEANGLVSILNDGMSKVAMGLTTITEIYRVAGKETV